MYKCYAFISGVFMKVDKRPGKESFWKCVEHKHIVFVTRSIEKFGVGHKLRKCFTVLPL